MKINFQPNTLESRIPTSFKHGDVFVRGGTALMIIRVDVADSDPHCWKAVHFSGERAGGYLSSIKYNAEKLRETLILGEWLPAEAEMNIRLK